MLGRGDVPKGLRWREQLERAITADCLLQNGILVGSLEEIMGHEIGIRSHETLRLCLDAVRHLAERRLSVTSTFVKTVVRSMVEFEPLCLDEVASFIVGDRRSRRYWDGLVSDADHPHRCPHCHGAAFIGFTNVDCKSGCGGSF